jgi:hypothetical protein
MAVRCTLDQENLYKIAATSYLIADAMLAEREKPR